MEILTVITKEMFEANVPAAKMPERNSSVYERMLKMMTAAYDSLIDTVVSPGFERTIDEDENLEQLCIRAVCLGAFVRTCRSLDLVLTATGFGIVSTESMAPASRARVDALIEETAVEELMTIDSIITKLTHVTDWGLTRQAKQRIVTLFYRPEQLKLLTSLAMTTQNWQHAMSRAIAADAVLRNEISEEYMEELLMKHRTASVDIADMIIVDKCCRFIGDFISQPGNPMPNRQMLQGIVEQLESYKNHYPTYAQSRLYARRHGDRFQNRIEDPTFFFM